MPLFWISLAFLTGLLAASFTLQPALFWAILAGLSSLTVLILLRFSPPDSRLRVMPYKTRWALLLALVCFPLGGLRWAAAHPPLTAEQIAWWNGRAGCSVEGWVARRPTRAARTNSVRVQATHLTCESETMAVHGLFQVQASPDLPLSYGARLRAAGQLITPPEDADFSYRAYLASQGIYSWMPRAEVEVLPGQRGSAVLRMLEQLRERGLGLLDQLYPPEQSALLQGILLGVDDNLSAQTSADFRASGLAHIIAISGFNMTILAGASYELSRRFLRGWWRLGLTSAVLALYTLLVGAGASVVRAMIMCVLALTGKRIGRSSGGLNALALAAAWMALHNANLLQDVSFQLSFAATLGLVLFSNPLQQGLLQFLSRKLPPRWARRLTGWAGEFFLTTFAAQTLTLPLIIIHFQRVSLVSFLANPLVLPVQSALMVLGLLSLLLGGLHPWLGQLIAWLDWPFLAWTLSAVRWFGHLPWAELRLPPLAGWLALTAAALLVLWFFPGGRTRKPLFRPFYALIPLLLASVLLLRAVFVYADPRLQVVVFDQRGERSALIRTPRGSWLYLGGAPASQASRWLPPFPRLNAFLLPADSAQDGLSGWLENLRPRQVIWCPDPRGLPAEIETVVRQAGTQALRLPPGAGLSLDGIQLRNHAVRGCAISLEYGSLHLELPTGSSDGTFSGIFRFGAAQEDQVALPLPKDGWLRLRSDGRLLWLDASQP